MADRISSRRGTANAFFLTLHTGLTSFIGGVGDLPPATEDSQGDARLVVASVVGLLLAGTWWLLLRSYRDLNKAKFDVIMDLEKSLPVAIYTDEWSGLKADPIKPWAKRYAELSFVERVIPVAFGLIYLALLLWTWCQSRG